MILTAYSPRFGCAAFAFLVSVDQKTPLDPRLVFGALSLLGVTVAAVGGVRAVMRGLVRARLCPTVFFA